MRILTIILVALCLLAMALPSAAEPETRVRVDIRVKAPPPKREVRYVPVVEREVILVPVRTGGGCISRQAGGCVGQYGGCVGKTAGCYGGQAGVPYGARLGRGQWNTPSGRPAAPGLFAVPGAEFPADGPLRAATRRFWGFDE